MIFTIQQEKYINKTISNLLTSKIDWVLKEEDRQYINTIDESLTICLGHGELDHLDRLDNLQETYHYYSNKKQLDYIIQVFRHTKEQIRFVLYKANDGELNGSHRIYGVTLDKKGIEVEK